jgi:hypothetical protein
VLYRRRDAQYDGLKALIETGLLEKVSEAKTSGWFNG